MAQFQGEHKLKNKNYFEGWYYKQVSGDEKSVISFIPGISTNKEDPHAFIQCIYKDDKDLLTTYYFRYELSEFSFEHEPFSVTIGGSCFTKKKIEVNLSNETKKIAGTLKLGVLKELKRTGIQPNIMGFLSYIPGLECNHEIISMDHELEGVLTIDGKIVDFDGGKGYLEKDWGTSFPEKYVWVQSNHFDQAGVGICCSVATVPVAMTKIEGFFCNLTVDHEEYRFATYNLSKVSFVDTQTHDFHIRIDNRKYRLNIKGTSKDSEELVAPSNGKMAYTIKEGLSGSIHVTLEDKKGKMILDTQSDHSGIEMVGYFSN